MRSIIRDITLTLEKVYSPNEAKQLSKLLLCYYTEMTPTELILSPFKTLSPDINFKLQNAIRRLLLHEPIQYVIGEEEFCGLRFVLTPSVLIPRPETAELVHLILQDYPSGGASLLDIGTGSGCIAIALDKLGSFGSVTAWDVSSEALELAQRNGELNNAKVKFEQQDITATQADCYKQQFEVIVSNPPYIDHVEKETMSRNVLNFEPHIALFTPQGSPLYFYRHIASFAYTALSEEGTLYLEINSRYGQESVAVVREAGFASVDLMDDLQGNNRMIRARR